MSVLSSTVMTRGVVFVHSTPAALCPHVCWALESVLGENVRLDWSAQPLGRSLVRGEFSWAAEPGTGARLASALRGFEDLRYEVTEEPSPGNDGERYAVTPTLGVFRASMSVNGDLLVGEDRLRALLATATGPQLAQGLDALLGSAWDDELEPYREAGEGAPVTWLHQVV